MKTSRPGYAVFLSILVILSCMLIVAGCPSPTSSTPETDDPDPDDPGVGTDGLGDIVWEIAGSDITTAEYLVDFGSTITVDASVAGEEVTIHYTLDGTDPTTDSATADGPLSVGPFESDVVAKAIAVHPTLGTSDVATLTMRVADSLWYEVNGGARQFVRMTEAGGYDGLGEEFRMFSPILPADVTREAWIVAYVDTAYFGTPTMHLMANWVPETELGDWQNSLQIGVPIPESGDLELDKAYTGSPEIATGSISGEAVQVGDEIELGPENTRVTFGAVGAVGEPVISDFRFSVPDNGPTVEGGIYVHRTPDTPIDLGTAAAPYEIDGSELLTGDSISFAGMTGPDGLSYYAVTGPAYRRYNINVVSGIPMKEGEEVTVVGLAEALKLTVYDDDDISTEIPGNVEVPADTFEQGPLPGSGDDGTMRFEIGPGVDVSGGMSYFVTIAAVSTRTEFTHEFADQSAFDAVYGVFGTDGLSQGTGGTIGEVRALYLPSEVSDMLQAAGLTDARYDPILESVEFYYGKSQETAEWVILTLNEDESCRAYFIDEAAYTAMDGADPDSGF
jgi:hypothetical protein